MEPQTHGLWTSHKMNTMNMKFWWNTQSAHSSGHPFSDFQELQHTHFPLLIKCQCCNGTTQTWKTTRGYHSHITWQFDTSDLNPNPFPIIHLLADTSNTNKITYALNYYFSLLLRTRGNCPSCHCLPEFPHIFALQPTGTNCAAEQCGLLSMTTQT
jgi:hypothetical protein